MWFTGRSGATLLMKSASPEFSCYYETAGVVLELVSEIDKYNNIELKSFDCVAETGRHAHCSLVIFVTIYLLEIQASTSNPRNILKILIWKRQI